MKISYGNVFFNHAATGNKKSTVEKIYGNWICSNYGLMSVSEWKWYPNIKQGTTFWLQIIQIYL